jgi:sirohydrochlorin ferrochelatase
MRLIFPPSIVRVGVRPEPDPAEPGAFVAPRPRGSRRPHTDAKVAGVRRLIEETTLTYGQIAARTGVGRASICRWTRDGSWQRPPFAPRATDTVPRARASAKLKRRTLAARLTAIAERYVRELEESACIDPDKLGEALELLKMAKLAAMGRRRRRKGAAVSLRPTGEPMRPIAELCAADVDLHRAPRAAIDDFLDNRSAPPEEPKRPGRRGRRWIGTDERHAWLLERERP